MIETVRGPVAPEALGRTLAHEHILPVGLETLVNFNHHWGEPWWDDDARMDDAAVKLEALRAAGFATIVDPTAIGLGRDVRRLQRLNERVDLNIVVCTGIYAFLELPQFFKYRATELIAEMFVRELREGIDGTGVKAAFIKCAVEEFGLVGHVPRILQATALAAVETGAPVMVHTNAAAQSGLLALDALVGAGVAPEKIVIAHAGDSNDLGYLRRLADAGAYLGFDRFNLPAFNSDEDRIRTTLAALEAGWGDRLHFAHDAAAFYDFMVGDPAFANERPTYLHIPEVILPRLRAEGAGEADIERILVENPGRWLSR